MTSAAEKWPLKIKGRKKGPHCVYRVRREVWLCTVVFNGCPTVSTESEPCRHRGTAQYRHSWMGLLTAARGLNKAQFICNISHFVTWFPTIPHISSVELAMGVLYPSYFLHRSAHFKLLHVMMVFFSPPFGTSPLFFPLTLKIKSINQKEWEKDTGTEGHLNPFRVRRASRSEINRKLKWSSKMVAIPFFFSGDWNQVHFLTRLPALYSTLLGMDPLFP